MKGIGVSMNVLIMSISKKIPMIKAVREAATRVDSRTRVFGADMNENCQGRYFVDQFWHVPPLINMKIELFINFCKINKITIVFPSRDGELKFFATHKKTLLTEGIHIMLSSHLSIKRCIDKFSFYQTLQHAGFPVIYTSLSLDFKCELYVVKERLGSGSINVGLGLEEDMALAHAKRTSTAIFQPFIRGREFSVDVYIDNIGKAKGAIFRERRLIVGGESQITVSSHSPQIEKLIMDIAEFLGLRGHGVFQLIIDEDNNPHILECNARFGGASTLSLAMGLDSFYWFIKESQGVPSIELPFIRSITEKTLVRYAEDMIL